MATSPFKTKSFHMTALDREMLDPERGGYQDISWWYQVYFDGELYPAAVSLACFPYMLRVGNDGRHQMNCLWVVF